MTQAALSTMADLAAANPEISRPRAASLTVGRLEVVPDLSGALWVPGERLLVVADLHLEKGSAFAARGVMLPPYDTAATLARLGEALRRHDPARVIALGDSFHDGRAGARMAPGDRDTLAGLQAGRDWLWIAGNHDPDPPDGLAGAVACEVTIADVVFRHVPSAATGPEIAGHLHPVARIGGAGRRRCFAHSPRRCILPAMGAYAGGLNVRDPAFAALFGATPDVHVLGRQRLYALGRRMLLPG